MVEVVSQSLILPMRKHPVKAIMAVTLAALFFMLMQTEIAMAMRSNQVSHSALTPVVILLITMIGNDSNKDINPLGIELCNGLDDDCNANVDDGCACFPITWI
jgi:hypothetical protein